MQVELALASTEDNHRDGLRARERLLLERHRDQWLAPLRAPRRAFAEVRPRRCFAAASLNWSGWTPRGLQPAPKCYSHASPVRELRITKTTIEELAELVANRVFPAIACARPFRPTARRRRGPRADQTTDNRGDSHPALAGLRADRCSAYRLADAEFDWPLVELDVELQRSQRERVNRGRDRFGAEVVIKRRADIH